MEILFYIAGVALGLALVVALVGWCGWRWIGRILERLAQEEEMGRMGRMGQMGPMADGEAASCALCGRAGADNGVERVWGVTGMLCDECYVELIKIP